MDTTRIGQGAMIAAVSGLILIISEFLPWFGLDTGGAPASALKAAGVDTSVNIWQSDGSLDIYLFIVGLVALLPALTASGAGGANLPMAPSAAAALLGGVGTVLVLYRLIDVPTGVSRKFGLILATIAVVGVTVGAYMAMQEEAAGYGERY